MARYYDQDASLAAGTMVGVRGKDRLIFFVAITKRVAVSNVLHTYLQRYPFLTILPANSIIAQLQNLWIIY